MRNLKKLFVICLSTSALVAGVLVTASLACPQKACEAKGCFWASSADGKTGFCDCSNKNKVERLKWRVVHPRLLLRLHR